MSCALALGSRPDGGPPDDPVAAHACECASWRATHRAQLRELFAAVDVPLLHVKGFAAEAWNGGRFVRDSGDVDVVVADMATAAAAVRPLVEIGYRLSETAWLHGTAGGGLAGVVIVVSERPGEPPRCVELSVGGFPAASFGAPLPVAVAEGADLDVDGVAVRIASRAQSLLVLCSETMHRDLVLRDALDLVLMVEEGGPDAAVPALAAAARRAHLGPGLRRLARWTLALLPDRADQAPRREWLREAARRAGPAPAGAWPAVGAALVDEWGWRRGGRLLGAYARYRAESWFFDRDRGLAAIQRLNRRRDPLALLTGTGAPVFTIPVHTGDTAHLRRAPGVRVVAEDPRGAWWAARLAGFPLLVLPVGVYLLSVDCVLEPSEVARLAGDLDRLAAAG